MSASLAWGWESTRLGYHLPCAAFPTPRAKTSDRSQSHDGVPDSEGVSLKY